MMGEKSEAEITENRISGETKTEGLLKKGDIK